MVMDEAKEDCRVAVLAWAFKVFAHFATTGWFVSDHSKPFHGRTA
jgi:hypothetical protein